jgi:hypothetical protein
MPYERCISATRSAPSLNPPSSIVADDVTTPASFNRAWRSQSLRRKLVRWSIGAAPLQLDPAACEVG